MSRFRSRHYEHFLYIWAVHFQYFSMSYHEILQGPLAQRFYFICLFWHGLKRVGSDLDRRHKKINIFPKTLKVHIYTCTSTSAWKQTLREVTFCVSIVYARTLISVSQSNFFMLWLLWMTHVFIKQFMTSEGFPKRIKQQLKIFLTILKF